MGRDMLQKKIKILYTIPNFDTAGSGKVVYDLIKNLDRTNFEPEICCFHTKGSFMEEIEKLQVKVHVFPFAINYRPFFTFPFRLLKIIVFFKKHQFDIIHSWHWNSDFSEPLASKLAGIPWIYTKKAMGWGNKAWKWRSALSTKIITINADMLSFFEDSMPDKIEAIPLGVDTHYYAPRLISKDTLLEGLTIDKNDFVIISVVNLIPKKGIEILIKAIVELNNPKIKLYIVGNNTGEYAQGLMELAKGNLNINFLGKKMDVRPYHNIADLFVIPTLELAEGLPIAPLEAMASGNIVIGSNVSGVKDILEPFPMCLFETNNVESLKAAILRILNMSIEERVQLAQNMRTHVENEFSLEHFIKMNSNLYRKILNRE